MNKVKESYHILDKLRLPNGMYLASTSSDYNYTWFRDTFYEVLPYLNKDCDRYEKTYHGVLDILREYEWKLDIHNVRKPQGQHEYIHIRYDAINFKEIDTPWAHAQFDAIGAILFGIGEGIAKGKKIIRDKKDHEIIQKLVGYLECCEYWNHPDSGMWEEWRELHSSSIGACVAGLESVRDIVFVPKELIMRGQISLFRLFPFESKDRPVDLSQLSLIYPYKTIVKDDAEFIVKRVEAMLLRDRGVIRYQGDSYYATNEIELGRDFSLNHYHGHEAEWCFGIPWLALCHMELGNIDKAKGYIEMTESLMLNDGSLPELYFAKSDKWNGNTPLGWGNAMYILAKEKYEKINNLY